MNDEPPDLSKLSPGALEFGLKPAEAMPADPQWGSDQPPGLAAVDERWQNDMVGTKSDLEGIVGTLLVHERMPDEVGRMLLTSRHLFVHSYFVHEFAFVAAVWSMFALEAALKDVLDLAEDHPSLKALTGKAEGRGLLTSAEGERLRMAARLRNALVHARGQGTFTVGAAFGVLETAHTFIHAVYERRSSDDEGSAG